MQINWNKYLEVLFKHIGKPNHHFVNWSKLMIQSPKQMEHVLKVLHKTSREVFGKTLINKNGEKKLKLL